MPTLPNELEWAFWIIALILSTFSAIFAFFAFRYSNKASNGLKEMVADSFISNGAAKLFFHDLKIDLMNNKESISLLNSNKAITYKQYNKNASISRMNPVPMRMTKVIAETEFALLGEKYINIKQQFDDRYYEIFNGDFSILYTNKKILKDRRQKMITYHKELVKSIEQIISGYTSIVSSGGEL